MGVDNDFHVYDLLNEMIINKVSGASIGYEQYIDILIVMEDSGYAFEYIKYLMKQKFKTLRIEMAQFHGYRGIKKTTKEIMGYACKNDKHFELIIAIYDSGNKAFYDQDKFNEFIMSIQDMEDAFKSIQDRVFIISPVCFEEMLMQYQNMSNLLGKQVRNQLYIDYQNDVVNNGNYIDMNKYRISNEYDENIFEREIDSVTDGTNYFVHHATGKIGKCWLRECYDKDMAEGCKARSCETQLKNKSDDIMINQHIYLIIQTISRVINHKYLLNKVSEQRLQNNDYIKQLYREVK